MNKQVTVTVLLFSILMLSQNQAEAEKSPMNPWEITKLKAKKINKPKTIDQLLKSSSNMSKSVGTRFTHGIYNYEILSENPNTVMVTGFASKTETSTTVDVPEVVENGSENYSVVKVGYEAFSGLGIKNVNLPSIIEVGDNAFYDNRLTELNLPNVHTIGDGAFSNKFVSNSYERISKLDLPNVKYIGEFAFGEHQLTELYLPEVEVIDVFAFGRDNNDGGLKTINLPKVLDIEFAAFSGNQLQTLNSTNIPNIVTISASAFSNNHLKIIDLPQVERVYESAFSGNKLENIYLPNVVEIRKNAFGENKSNFIKLFVSDLLTKAGDELFSLVQINGDIDIYNSGQKNIKELTALFSKDIVDSYGDIKFNSINLWTSEGYTYLVNDNLVKASLGDTFKQSVEYTLKKGMTIINGGEDWQESPTNEMNNIPLSESDVVQWYKDGLALQGQNKPQLNFTSLEKTDSGDYYAIVNGQKLSNFTLEVDASTQTEESIDSNATIDVEKIEDNGQVIFSSNASDKASIIFESVDQRNLKNEYPEKTQASIELKDTRTKANKYQVDASIEKNAQNLYDFSKNDMEITINPETKETDITVSKMITLTDQAQSIFATEYDSSLSKEEKSVTLNALLKSSNFDKLEPGKQYNTKIVWELTPTL